MIGNRKINWNDFQKGNDLVDIGEELSNLELSVDRDVINKSLVRLEDCFAKNMLLYDSSIQAIPFLLASLERFLEGVNENVIAVDTILNILVEISNSSHAIQTIEYERNQALIDGFELFVSAFDKSSSDSETQFCLIDLIGNCGLLSEEHKPAVCDLFVKFLQGNRESKFITFVKNWLSKLS